MEEPKWKRNTKIKLSLEWNIIILFVALTLGLLTAILIPPMPEFSLAFVSAGKSHLIIGISVSNSAAAAMSYDRIAAAAFSLAGAPPFAAVSDVRAFEQIGGERSHVAISLESSAPPPATATARIVVWMRTRYGGVAWPWKEIRMRVICEGVRVPAREMEEKRCVVDGKWRWREQGMFVGVFLVPFLLYFVVLCFHNFGGYR